MGHPRQVQRLPSDDLHRRRVPRRVHLLEDMDRVADGGQRVPKLVAHHRHELIFAVIRLFGGLERVPQLPSGRRELGEGPDDPLILPVELPLIGMAHDPHRSHWPAVNPKRNEQGLDKARLRQQGRKVTIRQVHQLGDILIDAHAARAGRTGHRTVPVRSEQPGHRFPSKHIPFEEADTGRIGSSAVSTSFWSMLRGFSVISRASTASARSRPSESGSRGGTCRELGANIDFREGGRGSGRFIRMSYRFTSGAGRHSSTSPRSGAPPVDQVSLPRSHTPSIRPSRA